MWAYSNWREAMMVSFFSSQESVLSAQPDTKHLSVQAKSFESSHYTPITIMVWQRSCYSALVDLNSFVKDDPVVFAHLVPQHRRQLPFVRRWTRESDLNFFFLHGEGMFLVCIRDPWVLQSLHISAEICKLQCAIKSDGNRIVNCTDLTALWS